MSESLPLTPRRTDTGLLSTIRGQPPHIPDHELLRCIGSGSYGEVWLARNVMGGYRAVKVIYRQTFLDERPYEREFTGIKKFEPVSRTHDDLIDILQVGRNDRDGCFYYVMELSDDAVSAEKIDPVTYEPKTLEREMLNRGRLPFEECLRLGLSLAAGLGHLHKHGLIHRDIKPCNIIFVTGIPKIADIGLVAAMVLVVAAAAYYQVNRDRRLARQNLADSHVAYGTRLIDEGDLSGALPSFAQALRLEQSDAERAKRHRVHLGVVLRQCPKLIRVWFQDGRINAAGFSPNGRRVVIAGINGNAAVWDVNSNLQVFRLTAHNPEKGVESAFVTC